MLRQWRIDDDNTMMTKVPSAGGTTLHQLVYSISDGLFDPSRATVLVRPVAGYVNPPVANDDVAQPKPAETTALVDALANDTDVDSDPETLRIVDVLDPNGVVEGGRVRVKVLDHAYSVPYVIEDEDGARAMALVHVPTGANGQPFVVAGTLIELGKDSSRTVELNDHVRSPRGRVVSVTTEQTVSASPSENLSVSLDDNRTLTLTSSGGYVGPAAVMLEVTDQDAVDQKDFGTAYVSIPVQVGPEGAAAALPRGCVTVIAGGLDRVVDIPDLLPRLVPRRHDARRRDVRDPLGDRGRRVARRRRPRQPPPHPPRRRAPRAPRSAGSRSPPRACRSRRPSRYRSSARTPPA